MKMTKTTYNLLLRLITGIAASLILVGSIALIGQGRGKAGNEARKSAAGVDTASIVMTIDGRDITSEEYLYWLGYYCDYYDQYMGYIGVDGWDTELEDGLTVGDYIVQEAEAQALSAVTQNAVIDNWTEESGITLTASDLADIEAQREASIEQFGSEKAYEEWLQTLGISDEFIARSLGQSYLVDHLYSAFCDENNPLHPTQEALDSYIAEHEYYGAQILFIDTCEMDSAEKDAARVQMENYSYFLYIADDIDATFAEFAEELGLNTGITTFAADEMEESFLSALMQVDVDNLTYVVESDEGYYLAIRKDPNPEDILNTMLNEEFAERCAKAEVVYNDKVYGSIDTLSFYEKMVAAQSSSIG